MYKIIMSIVLILATTLLGNNFSQRLANRRKCLCDVLEAISRMKSLISFSAFDIHKVVIDSFENTFLSELLSKDTKVEDFYTWWSNCIRLISKNFGLNYEDKELLTDLGKGLGATDIDGQLTHLELYNELFAQKLAGAKDMEKEKGRLYRILGFSLGCAVTLIIV